MYYAIHVKGPVVQRDAQESTSYLRLVFMLAYVRRDHPHTIVVALCDGAAFPKANFRFDDDGLVFQTAYALLLPAYTFAKASEIKTGRTHDYCGKVEPPERPWVLRYRAHHRAGWQ